jgi:S-DNA-T family DNA segregation ATPase FtsK/SpoIIIE
VATIAPLAVSLGLFALTRSPLTLAFAALGPVVAFASVVDATLSRRRTARREASRFELDVERTLREIEAAKAGESQLGSERLVELLERRSAVVARWSDTDSPLQIRIGCGRTPTGLRYEAAIPPAGLAPSVEEALSMLRQRAEWRDSAAIVVAPEVGIGIAGPRVLADPLLRSILLQLAATLSPAGWALEAPPGAEQWIGALPHDAAESSISNEYRFRSAAGNVHVARRATIPELPTDLDVIVRIEGNGDAYAGESALRPDLTSHEEARVVAAHIRSCADGAGIGAGRGSSLPDRALLAELESSAAQCSGLAAVVGTTRDGPLALDLVADGPHAIVGGTTGSGKSELLLSWILAIAATRSPQAVSFLFVDFKGGASFGPLVELPHSAGVLTDLDTEQALRAIESLSAELRFRERELASRGMRDIDAADSPPFARLVVVVDEYAALVDTFPELHPVFADIAARGRSLGVHLILCTQRPAGVVRDSILANCVLRLSLRVTSAADSVAVLGTGAAAELPFRPLGRALAAIGGAPPVEFQAALSERSDVDSVRERWASATPARSPWLPPLPTLVEPGSLDESSEAGAIAFGLADLPAEQAQRPARFRPRIDGSLLVLGASGAGKSGALAALATVPSDFEVCWLPSDVPGLWDAVTDVPDSAPTVDRLLLLDDVDSVLARCPDDYQGAVVELLARLLRDGPAARTWCALSAQRGGGALHGLGALCGSQLVLRLPNRAEHALSAADATPFVPNLAPGAGFWRSSRVQVARAERRTERKVALRGVVIDSGNVPSVIVSTRPDAIARVLRDLAPERRVTPLEPHGYGLRAAELDVSVGGAPPVLVADPELWQSQWTLFGSLRRNADVLFDGCSLAEVRALTRSRDLPPPFPTGIRPLWVRTTDGQLERASLGSLGSERG